MCVYIQCIYIYIYTYTSQILKKLSIIHIHIYSSQILPIPHSRNVALQRQASQSWLSSHPRRGRSLSLSVCHGGRDDKRWDGWGVHNWLLMGK